MGIEDNFFKSEGGERLQELQAIYRDGTKRLNLFQEIDLPQEERSSVFREYLKDRFGAYQNEEDQNEREGEFAVRRYFNHFHLREDDLRDKAILDVGCGDGDFIQYCLDQGIAPEAYGFDLRLNPKTGKDTGGHLVWGDFTKDLPFQDKKFDFILSHLSFEGFVLHESREEVQRVIESLIALLKEEGELRVFPIYKVPPEGVSEETKKKSPDVAERILKAKQFRENWERVLAALQEKGLINYTIQPYDIRGLRKGEKSIDFWLEELLIISKNRQH